MSAKKITVNLNIKVGISSKVTEQDSSEDDTMNTTPEILVRSDVQPNENAPVQNQDGQIAQETVNEYQQINPYDNYNLYLKNVNMLNNRINENDSIFKPQSPDREITALIDENNNHLNKSFNESKEVAKTTSEIIAEAFGEQKASPTKSVSPKMTKDMNIKSFTEEISRIYNLPSDDLNKDSVDGERKINDSYFKSLERKDENVKSLRSLSPVKSTNVQSPVLSTKIKNVEKSSSDNLNESFEDKPEDEHNNSTKSFKELVRQFNQEPTLNTSNTKLNTSQNANTNAEDVDLCFLVNSKDNIRYAVEGIQLYIDNVIEILRKASPNFNIRTAFISYNNDDCYMHDFTDDMTSIKNFISGIMFAESKPYELEGLTNALKVVPNLNWTKSTRILLHIPQEPLFRVNAEMVLHPEQNSEQQLKNALKAISSLNISYYYCNFGFNSTDLLKELRKAYQTINREIYEIVYKAIDHLIEYAIKRAIIKANPKLEIVYNRHLGMAASLRKHNLKTADYEEYDVEIYTPVVPKKLSEIYERLNYTKTTTKARLPKNMQPFTIGSRNNLYLVEILADKVKQYMKHTARQCRDRELIKSLAYFKEINANQAICWYLTREFNKQKGLKYKVKFLESIIMYVPAFDSYFSIELYEMDMKEKCGVKWITDNGDVNVSNYSHTLTTFAHWVYNFTGGYATVANIKGYKYGSEYILTSPAVFSEKDFLKFSATNKRLTGIKKFLETHKCGKLCQAMKIELLNDLNQHKEYMQRCTKETKEPLYISEDDIEY